MSELKENSFLCPYCGEQILKNASICRFCNHTTLVDLHIRKTSLEYSMGEVARALYENGPKLFSSFGSLRKQLETSGSFAKNVKPGEVEKIRTILSKYGIEVDSKSPISPTSSSKFPIQSLFLFIGVLSVGIFLFFFLYKPKQSGFSSDPPLTQSQINVQPMERSDQIEKNQQQAPPLSKQSHANIESLLISTATIMTSSGSGSAFFVSREGHLVSNQHVTKSEKEVQVLTYDGKQHKGTVLLSQDFYDLSLIKIENTNYPPLRLGDATKLHAGDTVWTIGAPHGLEFSVTKGIASYVGRNVGGKAFVQADVAINPGNSGGPMINDEGEVIGINNFIIKQTVGLNFAIPVNYLYMGASPILLNVVPTSPDTGTMITWRSWEKSPNQGISTAAGQSPDTSTSNNDEINDLNVQLKTSEEKLAVNRQKSDAALAAIDQKITAANSQYVNAQTVSDQERLGQSLRKLQLQKIDLEIERIDDYLAYIKTATTLMTKAKLISSPSLADHYTQELTKLSQSKTESEGIKSAKQSQRTTLQNQQF